MDTGIVLQVGGVVIRNLNILICSVHPYCGRCTVVEKGIASSEFRIIIDEIDFTRCFFNDNLIRNHFIGTWSGPVTLIVPLNNECLVWSCAKSLVIDISVLRLNIIPEWVQSYIWRCCNSVVSKSEVCSLRTQQESTVISNSDIIN